MKKLIIFLFLIVPFILQAQDYNVQFKKLPNGEVAPIHGQDSTQLHIRYQDRSSLVITTDGGIIRFFQNGVELKVVTTQPPLPVDTTYNIMLNNIHYIADVADGTDITNQLQDTINGCVDKDVIILPQGKFRILTGVDITNKDISIIGQGNDSITGTMLYRRYDDGTAYQMIHYTGTTELSINSRYYNYARYVCDEQKDNGAIISNDVSGIRHYAMSGNVGTGYDAYINLVKTAEVKVSSGLPDADLYTCGFNYYNATPVSNGRQVRYVLIFSYLTESEVDAVIGIMETYLDSFGSGLY